MIEFEDVFVLDGGIHLHLYTRLARCVSYWKADALSETSRNGQAILPSSPILRGIITGPFWHLLEYSSALIHS